MLTAAVFAEQEGSYRNSDGSNSYTPNGGYPAVVPHGCTDHQRPYGFNYVSYRLIFGEYP
jgi:hypothetical protein